jgi:hypothetical protein
MAAYEMHTSGHPVPWDVEGGADHRELVSMLHVRHGDYAHWAVRIDRATRRITHISAGPVVKSVDYRNEVRRYRAGRPRQRPDAAARLTSPRGRRASCRRRWW